MAEAKLAPPIGDNGPPLRETAKMAIDDQLATCQPRLDELLASFERTKCETTDDAGKVADLAKLFLKLRKKVDGIRADVKEPYSDAANVVQAAGNAFFAQIDAKGSALNAMLKKFDADQREIAAAAKRLQDAKDQAERDRAEQIRREDAERARALGVQAAPPPPPPPPPEPERPAPRTAIGTGDYGASAGRVVRKVPQIVDVYALPESVMTAPKVTEAILSVVRSMRVGNPDLEIKGIELVDDFSVRIR